MPELKTTKTGASVTQFLAAIPNAKLRAEAVVVLQLMKQVTKAPPRMWGPTMVGFGDYHYVYESGHEGDSFVVGFSPRKTGIVVYLLGGVSKHAALLAKLGRHKTGKACLYLGPLDQVHLPTLKALVAAGYAMLVGPAKRAKAAPKKPAAKKKAVAKRKPATKRPAR